MRDRTSIFKARCVFCKTSFDIRNMGEAALCNHCKSQKHSTKQKNASSTVSMRTFLGLGHLSGSNVRKETLGFDVIKEDTLRAEILWTLNMISKHHSYNSNTDISELFQTMFHDSEIATQFAGVEKKSAYMCCFGLAPYFSDLLLKKVKDDDAYVFLFDESLNRETKRKQMDTRIRIWCDGEVKTRYISS